jgi:hypothetical protein
MVKIPDELYPDASEKNRNYVVGWRIKESVVGFGFEKEDDVISYASKLSREDAESFLESGSYLNVIKKHEDSTVKLVLLISAIEKNISNNYKPLDWFVKNGGGEVSSIIDNAIKENKEDCKSALISSIEEIVKLHTEKFGLANNFANFVVNFSDKDELKKMIRSFVVERKDTPLKYNSDWIKPTSPITSPNDLSQYGIKLGTAGVPKCYQWTKCYTDEYRCEPKYGCIIDDDKSELENTGKKWAKMVYTMRSEAVHAAGNKTILPKSDAAMQFSTIVVNDKVTVITTSIDEIESFFINCLRNYFDSKTT